MEMNDVMKVNLPYLIMLLLFFYLFFPSIFYLRNYVKEACAKVLKCYQPATLNRVAEEP